MNAMPTIREVLEYMEMQKKEMRLIALEELEMFGTTPEEIEERDIFYRECALDAMEDTLVPLGERISCWSCNTSLQPADAEEFMGKAICPGCADAISGEKYLKSKMKVIESINGCMC